MTDHARHQESFTVNKARWDEVVAIHVASADYQVQPFLAGQDTLLPIEAREIGDIRGKSLIHLQCHFGLDTLNLARRGAHVTGLDFSPQAIAAARALAARAGLEARFVEGNLYDAPSLIAERFDLAYVTWGAINWLPDIKGWAKVVAKMLKPSGELYLLEAHPFAFALDQVPPGGAVGVRDAGAPLCPTFPYFGAGVPIIFDSDTTYTGDDTKVENTRTHEFLHPMSDILGGLIEAGLTLTSYNEHDSIAWAMWPLLVEGADRMYRMPEGHTNLPLSFSLKARKA
ncbi:class I SAM-dependent methyltransferase [Dongia sp.]|uniref:class I SAM-dependent methyltransferase n=1 Tax=Dongia sp. TaxID=1977262 RepID=UPI0035B1B3DC